MGIYLGGSSYVLYGQDNLIYLFFIVSWVKIYLFFMRTLCVFLYDWRMENTNKETYIYIDESGSMGLDNKEPYFIICALILNKSDFKIIKNTVKRITEEISNYREIKELHAHKMSFEERVISFN